jgi:basic membrane lipoprotein Med (substrate-binding protein (PBP1-ABC) superfamily)
MVERGADLVFATSMSFERHVREEAEQHPGTIFMACSGRSSAENLGTYEIRMAQPMYLAGIVAGRMTRSKVIGVVAAHPVADTLVAVNALTLGALSVNPHVIVDVIWTNSWSDEAAETQAVEGLVKLGADVVACDVDSPRHVLQAAARHGIHSIGLHAIPAGAAPKGFLTAVVPDWSKLVVDTTRAVIDGTWRSSSYLGDLADGAAQLAPLSPDVPESVRREVELVAAEFRARTRRVFHGPLLDRAGRLRLEAGQPDDLAWLRGVDFFVKGVRTLLPRHHVYGQLDH